MKEILLVDDDDDLRVTMSAVLEQCGYRVVQAADGRQALDYLQAGGRPSLILLDLMMPNMNGWQFQAEREKDPALAAIPLIAVTASRLAGSPMPWASEVVYKPFSLDQFLASVARVWAAA
jgi:CheY-like chemotaxis protein